MRRLVDGGRGWSAHHRRPVTPQAGLRSGRAELATADCQWREDERRSPGDGTTYDEVAIGVPVIPASIGHLRQYRSAHADVG